MRQNTSLYYVPNENSNIPNDNITSLHPNYAAHSSSSLAPPNLYASSDEDEYEDRHDDDTAYLYPIVTDIDDGCNDSFYSNSSSNMSKTNSYYYHEEQDLFHQEEHSSTQTSKINKNHPYKQQQQQHYSSTSPTCVSEATNGATSLFTSPSSPQHNKNNNIDNDNSDTNRHDDIILNNNDSNHKRKDAPKFHHDYIIIREIEKGPFSTVFEVMHRVSQVHYAAKMIYRRYLDPSADAAVHSEVDILHNLHSSTRDCGNVASHISNYNPKEGIIKLIHFYVEPNRFVLVMDYLPGGDLFSKMLQLKRIPEEQVKQLAYTLFQTLLFLHDHNIVHRDIKPQNLLLKKCTVSSTTANIHSSINSNTTLQHQNTYTIPTDNQVQLCIADFGLATRLSSAISVDDYGRRSNLLYERCGTPAYVAPEVLNGRGYDERVDLWAVGAVLFLLLSGTPPFVGDDGQGELERDNINEQSCNSSVMAWEGSGYNHHFAAFCSNTNLTHPSSKRRRSLIGRILRGNTNFCEKDWINVTEEAQHLVFGLLTVNPEKRLTAEEALEHEWFASIRNRHNALLQQQNQQHNRHWLSKSHTLSLNHLQQQPITEPQANRSRTTSDGTVNTSNQSKPQITESSSNNNHDETSTTKKKNSQNKHYSLRKNKNKTDSNFNNRHYHQDQDHDDDNNDDDDLSSTTQNTVTPKSKRLKWIRERSMRIFLFGCMPDSNDMDNDENNPTYAGRSISSSIRRKKIKVKNNKNKKNKDSFLVHNPSESSHLNHNHRKGDNHIILKPVEAGNFPSSKNSSNIIDKNNHIHQSSFFVVDNERGDSTVSTIGNTTLC